MNSAFKTGREKHGKNRGREPTMTTAQNNHTIRIATRQSKLAQAQARLVGEALKKAHDGLQYELVFVTTTGDKFMGDLARVGGKVAFVKEIQQTLLDGKADIAAHSMKDLPTDEVAGLKVSAVLERADIRDAIICRQGEDFASLKEGSVVGTSSVRRQAQILNTFPHLRVKPVRGNVHTRLEKLASGDVDALVLAKAGLDRVDLTQKITAVLEPDMMCPSVSQGAICLEIRTDDEQTEALVEKVNHPESQRCVDTERAFLDRLGGHCHTPIAGFVQITANRNLRLIGLVASLDGRKVLRTRHKAPYDDWQKLARTAADDLMEQGAGPLIADTTQEGEMAASQEASPESSPEKHKATGAS